MVRAHGLPAALSAKLCSWRHTWAKLSLREPGRPGLTLVLQGAQRADSEPGFQGALDTRVPLGPRLQNTPEAALT